MPLGARLLRVPALILGRTWRLRVVPESAALDRLAALEGPVIFAFWHESLYLCGYRLYRFARRYRRRLAVLASLSRDGELVARMARASGIVPVRGSTSRAGLAGLLALRRAIARERASVIAAPDGPRGPARRCQSGVIVLAAASGAPIVPLAAAADRRWRLGSWDRLVIAKPFARVAVAVGEPLPVPQDASVEAVAARLTAELDRLAGSARAAAEGQSTRSAPGDSG